MKTWQDALWRGQVTRTLATILAKKSASQFKRVMQLAFWAPSPLQVPALEPSLVQVMDGPWSPRGVMRDAVAASARDEPFYVMDLGEVVARYNRWCELMPTVQPFYAVKCNDDRVLVAALAALGAGFDCASRAEIELISGLGVAPERIIFANPAKMSSHIRRAGALGVRTMTFDSEVELLKVKQLMPEAQLVIRIRCEAAAAQCPLGMKFGCDPLTEAPRLLKIAATHRLNVVGVSFHVGSGAGETAVYARAISLCRTLFTEGRKLGHHMALLDIGGGFPGNTGTDIYEVSQVINSALETHFPGDSVRVIAEPGRYFAAAAYTLATLVHSIRDVPSPEGAKHTMYFINDGVYGSFNCILYDHQHVKAYPLKESTAPPAPCSVWGPSCDGLDCVLPSTALPPMAPGAWLYFPDMGAYTLPVASPFNGFPVPSVQYVCDRDVWTTIKDLLPLSSGVLTGEPLPPASPSPPPLSPPPSPPPRVFIECALK